MDRSYRYVGEELALFAGAWRWKAYVRSQIRPFLRGDVLEVGAGIGGSTRALCQGANTKWTCLEPDPELAQCLVDSIREHPIAPGIKPEVIVGTTVDLVGSRSYDTLLYLDVLEHIEDDRLELERAARLLKPQGHLVVVSPAHPCLFSAFDQAVGHVRRYRRKQFLEIRPTQTTLIRLRYLDSVGLLASLANRVLLRSSMPTERQIGTWDKVMVPCSRLIDPIFGYRVGKSILAVWRRSAAG